MLEINKPNADQAVAAFTRSAVHLNNSFRRFILDPHEGEILYLIECGEVPVLIACVFRCEELAGIEFCELAIFDVKTKKRAFMTLFDQLERIGIRDITCTAQVASRSLRTAELVGFDAYHRSSLKPDQGMVFLHQALR